MIGKRARIDQLVTNMSFGDAISDHCLAIRRALRSWGFLSDIYAQYVDPKMRGEAIPHTAFFRNKSRRSLLIFHHSIGSEIIDPVMACQIPTILVYHNITPPQFFTGVSPQLLRLVDKGRRDLVRLRDRVGAALGDSEFNRQELVEAGFRVTDVLPILVDLEKYRRPGAPHVLRAFHNSSGTKLLFVGRIVPNKRQEDVIKTFAYYQKRIDPEAKLFLVGSHNGTDQYLTRIKYLVHDLGLSDVRFTGQVSFDELIAYYRVADAFLCMSEHEGFCVPLLEAMHFNLPIVAFKSTAVPHTLGDAGILFIEKRYDVVAELIHLLQTDQALRGRVLDTQRERLKHFSRENTEAKLRYWVERVVH